MPRSVVLPLLALAALGRSAMAQTLSPADTLVIESRALGRARTVYVSLPSSHGRTTRTYPVIVVLDGEAYFEPAVTVATTLSRLGHVPEAIVVAIPNPSNDFRDRVHDMTPPGLSVSGSSLNEGGDDFLDFIEAELFPEVDRRYRGGRPHVLVGHSSGGVIATWAAATRPSAFPVVVSIDAPINLGDGWLADRMDERVRVAAPPLRYVSLEARFGWPDERWNRLVGAAPASWLLQRRHVDGESHESMFFLGAYEGLKWAFSDYSVVGAPFFPVGTAVDVFDHYAAIEAEFDTELPPPAPVLDPLVEDLLTEGRIEPAERALAWLDSAYGSVSARQRASLDTMFQRAREQMPLEESVAELRATPFPTPQEIAPYVGEWVGETDPNGPNRHALRLRITIVDGEVRAELGETLGGDTHTEAVEYLKVGADGIEFGKMNGMRPAGMLIRTGRVQGDVMKGELRMRGVLFVAFPIDRLPPPEPFRLTRR